MNKKKLGRPLKSGAPLTHDVKVRLSDEEYAALTVYCEENGLRKAEAIRESIKAYIKGGD